MDYVNTYKNLNSVCFLCEQGITISEENPAKKISTEPNMNDFTVREWKEVEQDFLIKLECGEIFHKNCINTWFKEFEENISSSYCPKCNDKIFKTIKADSPSNTNERFVYCNQPHNVGVDTIQHIGRNYRSASVSLNLNSEDPIQKFMRKEELKLACESERLKHNIINRHFFGKIVESDDIEKGKKIVVQWQQTKQEYHTSFLKKIEQISNKTASEATQIDQQKEEDTEGKK